jgi:hypothetical protein
MKSLCLQLTKFTISVTIFITIFQILVSYLNPITIAQNSAQTIVKVDPPTISVNKSDVFTVNITVIDVQNLYGVEVDVRWNTSLLQILGVDIRLGVNSHPDGVLYEPFINITQENIGEYVIGATSYTPAPSFNGSGNIIRITFQAVNNGETTIDLETKLYDYPPPDREPRESLPIPHTTMDGNIIIIPEFSNAITIAIFLILATLLTLLMRNKKKLKFYEANRANMQRKDDSLASEVQ